MSERDWTVVAGIVLLFVGAWGMWSLWAALLLVGALFVLGPTLSIAIAMWRR